MLDMNGDGNALDDILRLAGRAVAGDEGVVPAAALAGVHRGVAKTLVDLEGVGERVVLREDARALLRAVDLDSEIVTHVRERRPRGFQFRPCLGVLQIGRQPVIPGIVLVVALIEGACGIAVISLSITYLLTVTGRGGCINKDSVFVRILKMPKAPNTFTPNGDGNNDYFFIQGDEKVANVVIFRVYDRWGELVFETSNTAINIPEQGWDGIFRGQPATSGVYTWYADVLFRDGETIQIRGDVTLLR